MAAQRILVHTLVTITVEKGAPGCIPSRVRLALMQTGAAQDLSLRKVIGNRERRDANIQHGGDPLKFVMAGFVEAITDPDHTGGFTCEVSRQPTRRAAKKPSHGIELFSAILQVGMGNGEVCRAQSGDRHKEKTILPVPESMRFGRFGRSALHKRRCPHRVGIYPYHRGFLSEAGTAQSCEQNQAPYLLPEHRIEPGRVHEVCNFRHQH